MQRKQKLRWSLKLSLAEMMLVGFHIWLIRERFSLVGSIIIVQRWHRISWKIMVRHCLVSSSNIMIMMTTVTTTWNDAHTSSFYDYRHHHCHHRTALPSCLTSTPKIKFLLSFCPAVCCGNDLGSGANPGRWRRACLMPPAGRMWWLLSLVDLAGGSLHFCCLWEKF